MSKNKCSSRAEARGSDLNDGSSFAKATAQVDKPLSAFGRRLSYAFSIGRVIPGDFPWAVDRRSCGTKFRVSGSNRGGLAVSLGRCSGAFSAVFFFWAQQIRASLGQMTEFCGLRLSFDAFMQRQGGGGSLSDWPWTISAGHLRWPSPILYCRPRPRRAAHDVKRTGKSVLLFTALRTGERVFQPVYFFLIIDGCPQCLFNLQKINE